ncbi:MAG: hypothetical protein Q8R79_09210 [Legionellaceae bacterium]|nr:hypothetical protein [Legionellaceae bacterium]
MPTFFSPVLDEFIHNLKPKPTNPGNQDYLRYMTRLNHAIKNDRILQEEPNQNLNYLKHCLPTTQELLAQHDKYTVFNLLCQKKLYTLIWILLESDRLTQTMFAFTDATKNPLSLIVQHEEFELLACLITDQLLSPSNVTQDIVNQLIAANKMLVLERLKENELLTAELRSEQQQAPYHAF